MKRKEKKTKISSIYEGIDFLGWNRKRVEKIEGLRITPTKKSVKHIKEVIKEEVQRNKNLKEITETLNPRLMGWCNYYSTSQASIPTFAYVGGYLYGRMRRRRERRKLKTESRKEE